MNTLEAIAKRKSTRAYKPDPISEEALSAILKAANAAPVAMAKYDSLHITVIQSENVIDRINEMTAEMFFRRMGVKRTLTLAQELWCLYLPRPQCCLPKWNLQT